jgi:hypothetical protein
MQKLSEIVGGFVLQCRGTSSTCAGIGVDKRSEPIAHANQGVGFATIASQSMSEGWKQWSD